MDVGRTWARRSIHIITDFFCHRTRYNREIRVVFLPTTWPDKLSLVASFTMLDSDSDIFRLRSLELLEGGSYEPFFWSFLNVGAGWMLEWQLLFHATVLELKNGIGILLLWWNSLNTFCPILLHLIGTDSNHLSRAFSQVFVTRQLRRVFPFFKRFRRFNIGSEI